MDDGCIKLKYMHGNILYIFLLGCMNSPAKASRFCTEHLCTAMEIRNDKDLMTGEDCTKEKNKEEDVLPIKVLNTKCTRSGNFYEVCLFEIKF